MTENERKEILIGTKVYDVKNFARVHPGGRIINFLMNTNATQAYKEFHFKSTRADNFLRGLPSREATEEDLQKFLVKDSQPILDDFGTLRKELEEEGWFRTDYVHLCRRFLEIIFLHVFGLFLIINNHLKNNGLVGLGLLVVGISTGRCGWLMHEFGHLSGTGIWKIDILLQQFWYGFGTGMSGRWWRIQHNKHHCTPQKLDHDADLETLPLVAFCEDTLKGLKNTFGKQWIGFQHVLFVPLICPLVTWGWKLYLHPRCIVRKKEWMEAFFILARYACVAYSCHACFGWLYGILYYNISIAVAAIYIFLNFAVSHTHLPTVPANTHINWVAYSAYHTLNVSHNPLCNWWMSYLNFQIEHHLFPSMPQFRFVALAPRIKALFNKHGYPYQYTSYWTAMAMTFRNLHKVAISEVMLG